jgi:hypothetical protein
VRGHISLARISGSLPLEVPIDGAALHEMAPRSAHRADNDFLVSDGGCEGRIRLFYKNSERKELEFSAVGREVCYATTQGAVEIRRGGDNANVIFRQGR